MPNLDANNNSLPAWEVALGEYEVVATVAHKVEEWAIIENNFDTPLGSSKIIYRWPAHRPEARAKVEAEYDAKGYPLDGLKCFAKIVWWSDAPQEWEIVGGAYF